MKQSSFFKLLMLLGVMSVMFSCSQQEKAVEVSLSKKEKRKIINLLERSLTQSEVVTKGTRLPVKVKSAVLQEWEGNYYLVSRYVHSKRVTKTLLERKRDNELVYGGISCTSTACSTDEGCIPHKSKVKCTSCSFSTDCTKIVTAESGFEKYENSEEKKLKELKDSQRK